MNISLHRKSLGTLLLATLVLSPQMLHAQRGTLVGRVERIDSLIIELSKEINAVRELVADTARVKAVDTGAAQGGEEPAAVLLL